MIAQQKFKYRCQQCGKWHSGSPSYADRYPVYFFDVPEDEREQRIQATSDLCRIEPAANDADGATIYCIRVTLDIPIKGAEEPFTWGVWVSQSQASYEKYVATYNDDQSAEQSFGWLAINMPFYKTTEAGEPLTHLECDVHWGSPGQRPTAHLWECDHQLALDQLNGISWDKAAEIASFANQAFYGHDKPA